jgi:hypothetical protein
MDFVREMQKYAQQPISTQILLGIFSHYKRPYDKIDELEKKGYLIQLRRGLYVPTELFSFYGPEPFLIANHLMGPSYISLDSALYHWGLIPERVYQTTSVTTKLSKSVDTKVGLFSYSHLPLPYYSYGIEQLILTDKQHVLIASQEKALCDKIITTSGIIFRSKKQVISYLVEDLRIDKSQLRNLNTSSIISFLEDCPKRLSIEFLIKTLIDL